MKRYITMLILICAFIGACKRDELIGQYAIDDIPPGPVTAPSVENLPGGAVITYAIPDDIDLLYVKAIYERNGKVVEQKSSGYGNKLTVEGFGKSQEQNITLVAYDRSENASSPVSVKIHPLDAPIYSILNSINIVSDFGGIKLDWSNPLSSDVVLTVLTSSDKYGVEEFTEAENFYTKAKVGTGNVRGYPDTERPFGVFLRDRWGNLTDTVMGNYTPIYEVQLSKSLFRRWNPPGLPYNAYTGPNWWIENLWDGLIGSAETGTPNDQGFANLSLQFTFDMGQLAKMSRFKINQRPDPLLVYNHGHPKKFQLWGSASSNVNADFAGWTLLGSFESTKPSGLPNGEVTDEDIQYANVRGEDWNVPLDAPPVRYLRLVCQETWGKASEIQIMEMTVWGDNKY